MQDNYNMKSCVTISLVPSLKGGPWILWNDIEESLRVSSELGFEGVELFTAGPSINAKTPLAELLHRYNLSLGAVGTGAGKVLHGLSLTDSDLAVRNQAKDFIKDIIRFGAENEAPAILGSMQGSYSNELPRDTAIEYLRESLEELGQFSMSEGTFFIYEPLNRYETNLFNLFDEACSFVKSLETKGVKVLADLFHMNIEESDIAASIGRQGDTLGHVHFADSNRRAIGYGHTNINPIRDCLKKINYQGYISAEAFAWPDPITAAKQTIDSFRKFFL